MDAIIRNFAKIIRPITRSGSGAETRAVTKEKEASPPRGKGKEKAANAGKEQPPKKDCQKWCAKHGAQNLTDASKIKETDACACKCEGHKNVTAMDSQAQAPKKHADDASHSLNASLMTPEQAQLFKQACEKFEYFWLDECVFSQWYPSVFYIDNMKFTNAEQYMMYQKAVFADDLQSAEMIMKETSPQIMKKLGRKLYSLNFQLWKSHCLHVVKQGSIGKFSQNKALKKQLYHTYPKILVEASPYDTTWGIGVAEHDPRAWDQTSWKGTNWLGFILTEVRDELMWNDGIIKQNERKLFLDILLAGVQST